MDRHPRASSQRVQGARRTASLRCLLRPRRRAGSRCRIEMRERALASPQARFSGFATCCLCCPTGRTKRQFLRRWQDQSEHPTNGAKRSRTARPPGQGPQKWPRKILTRRASNAPLRCRRRVKRKFPRQIFGMRRMAQHRMRCGLPAAATPADGDHAQQPAYDDHHFFHAPLLRGLRVFSLHRAFWWGIAKRQTCKCEPRRRLHENSVFRRALAA